MLKDFTVLSCDKDFSLRKVILLLIVLVDLVFKEIRRFFFLFWNLGLIVKFHLKLLVLAYLEITERQISTSSDLAKPYVFYFSKDH